MLVTTINRKDEGQWRGKVRGDLLNDLFLDTRFANQLEPSLGQIAHAAVKQSARTAAGTESKIVLLDQAGAQSAQRGISNNAGANDAPANHKDIEWGLRERAG